MTFVLVADGVVQQKQPYMALGFIPAPDWVVCGSLWDGGEFSEAPIPEPVVTPPHLNGGGLIRFATFPVAVAEAIKMIGVQRVSKGRYRALHETAMLSDQYSVTTSLMDSRPLVARVTGRTDSFTEVRVTDLAGVAQDPLELTIETKRVIY